MIFGPGSQRIPRCTSTSVTGKSFIKQYSYFNYINWLWDICIVKTLKEISPITNYNYKAIQFQALYHIENNGNAFCEHKITL